ncbi:hypothetical protein [Methanocaldococcus sp.]
MELVFKDRKVTKYKKNGKEYPVLHLPVEFKKYIGKRYKITTLEGNKIIIEFY